MNTYIGHFQQYIANINVKRLLIMDPLMVSKNSNLASHGPATYRIWILLDSTRIGSNIIHIWTGKTLDSLTINLKS